MPVLALRTLLARLVDKSSLNNDLLKVRKTNNLGVDFNNLGAFLAWDVRRMHPDLKGVYVCCGLNLSLV